MGLQHYNIITNIYCILRFVIKYLNKVLSLRQRSSLNMAQQTPKYVGEYFYSKTNQMHNISNLFYIGTTLYMLRTVSPSITRSLRLYIKQQVYVIQILWLLASKQLYYLYYVYLMQYVQSQTPDDGRKDSPKRVECCSKIK